MDFLLGIPAAGYNMEFIAPADSHLTHLVRTKRFVASQSLVEQGRLSALYIIFIIAILVINTFVVAVIIASKAMRASSRHVLIISVCVGDLLMGVFVLPVLLNLQMRHGDEIKDCPTFFAMRLFADFLIPSVTTLAMLALNVDYLLRLCCSAYSEGSSRSTLIVVLFLLPWMISGAVLIPLYVDGMYRVSDSWLDKCDIEMGGLLTRTLLAVSFFPQACLLLILTLAVSCMYLLRRETYSLDVCGERIRAPVDVCLASFGTLLLYAPAFLAMLLTTEGYSGCEVGDVERCAIADGLYTVALWCMFTKSWLLPFCWAACADTRVCVRQLFVEGCST
ncbi:5-hydroxytryptamine receptor 7 [Elysia marginata]|uniref:5-hydroxytryptamine receptor 7 n=1 Tax=Elysia marginata TaxID=1093978 RepID=A0AAV4IWG1_9GAST|nr:5-hydroxytryptamine receptor 7 [Elysia marginata]